MADSEPGPSNIFRSLMGNISKDQLESYKEMKLGQSNLVINDSEDDLEEEEEDEEEEEEMDDSISYPSSQDYVEMDAEADSTNQEKADSDDDEGIELSSAMASDLMKYINGEISFNEFHNILGQADEKASAVRNEKQDTDVRDSGLEAEKELAEELESKKKPRRRKLPKSLQWLMGEANLCFARGEHEDAIKICMELIRQAPTAPEPFQTLGLLYEDVGDMEKSFQFSLIGAYLNPSDSDEWSKLADMSVEKGDIKQAITCLSKAIKYDPENIGLIWQRCILYEQEGDRKRALMGYEAIMQLLKPEQGSLCIELSREIVKNHHEKGDIPAAIQVMEKAFHKFPTLITSEDVNLLVEMQISQQRYRDALDVLRRHCGIVLNKGDGTEIDVESIENDLEGVEKCTIPDVLPIDLLGKLIMCLIHLNAQHLVPDLWEPLQQENVEEVGDLYLDVAESYMHAKEYQRAITILSQLVATKNYNMAAVWLRYGECLSAVRELEKATEVYKKVVDMAPCHSAARLSLSSLLKQSGKTQEAISALKQSYEKGQKDVALDLELLLERCSLLYSQEQWDEFIKCGELVLSSNFRVLKTPAEFQAVCNNLSYRKTETVKEIEESNNTNAQPKYTETTKISEEELWEFYLKMWQTLYHLHRFKELEALSIRALTCTSFSRNRIQDTNFLTLLALFYSRNNQLAYFLIRYFLLKDLKNNNAWNLFSQINAFGEDLRHVRFCLRLTPKHPNLLPLQFLNGHTALVAGSYKHALGEYTAIFQKNPNDPFIVFCIALTFIHMACQRFIVRRHCLTIQGIAFLTRYYELRGECQESLYNIGRAMHQLGLYSSAVHFYKRALACPLPPDLEEEQEIFDLSNEISFNLALIYQANGAAGLAKMYLNKYSFL